ncbi:MULTISPECIES: glycosyltransferase family 4 protein [Bacillus cereus group]|uniref:glycosyltransferase family 4 protein n=1 Tax=Bacillus cereus group TaxID=86661 RepID=UPI00187985EF|nr:MULTISPECIES: glycosyltransferase family 4 protein [Bacillus cereus group]MBE7097078.1 glycosyltransferase family 4 protein [Bacillus cereus]MDR4939555.1 glycosyltransferase family 4 protein [Bacillus wiedmannii]
MKINIIGTVPPPIGGISVHIKRTKQVLDERKIESVVYNEAKWGREEDDIYSIKNYKSFMCRLPFLKADVFHFHSIDIKIRILLGVYNFFGKKIILTVHGESLSDQLKSSSFFTRYLLLKSLNKLEKIICVNSSITNNLIQFGVENQKVITVPGYIHPQEDKKDILSIPETVWGFIKRAPFLISANGCVRFYKNEDLYGIDMLIELIKRLKDNRIETSLLFAVLDKDSQTGPEKTYYQELKERIIRYKLENYIMFYEVENTEFYPILQKTNLFIRPTNTDGLGVSITEAIHYNVPSVASDVCERPTGTMLFESRNLDDLFEKVIKIIQNYNEHVDEVRVINNQDYAESLLSIYREVSSK